MWLDKTARIIEKVVESVARFVNSVGQASLIAMMLHGDDFSWCCS